MADKFYKPKLLNIADFQAKIQQLIETDQDNCQIVVPYGLQRKFQLTVSKPIRICLHAIVSGADNFVLHYGAGVCNKVAAWMKDNIHARPRKTLVDATIERRLLHIIYIPSSFLYVGACADMTIKTFGNQFSVLASLELLYTVLDMIYCDFLDAIVAGGVGFVQILKLGQCLHDPPVVCNEIKLPLMNCNKPWIFQLSLDTKNREILAVCHEAIFFITGKAVADLSCTSVLENRHSQSLSTAIAYPQQHYIITGIEAIYPFR